MAESSHPASAGPSAHDLAEALEEGLAVCRGGRVVLANARLRAWLGRQDLEGRMFGELLAADEAPCCGRAIRVSLQRDSGERRVEVRGHAAGESEIFTVRDITHVESLEKELLRAGRELQELRPRLEAARERTRRESEDREDLLTLVAHELRTPATVISGYARLLLSEQVGPLEGEQRRFLEETLTSCRRLNAFIGNLLEVSRQASGDIPLELEEAPLEPTLHGIAAFLKPLLEERGLEIEIDVQSGGSVARFDVVRIEQVLINLLNNAIRHASGKKPIALAATRVEEQGRQWVEVSVSDDGGGVEPADRERIFLPYVRARDARSDGGLGLGLSIARRIVEAHGGTIRVEPGAIGGSRFAFTLPAPVDACGGPLG